MVAKHGIEDDHPTAVDELIEYMKQFSIYNTYSNDRSNPYPTLQIRKNQPHKNEELSYYSSDADEAHYTDQRRY